MGNILPPAPEIHDPLWQTIQDAFIAFTVTPVLFIFGLCLYFGWITRSKEHPFLWFTGPSTTGQEDER